MFKNNDKKQRLTRQEKHNLKEFGTTDAAKINEMINTLKKAKQSARLDVLKTVCNKEDGRKNYVKLASLIINAYAHIEKEFENIRKTKSIWDNREIITPTAKFLRELDKKLLFVQMEVEGYTKEQSSKIYSNMKKNYMHLGFDLESNNIYDYEINSRLDVKLKPTKVRYEIATKKEQLEKEML